VTYEPILEEGRNCWRKTHAARVSFLVDADAYFRAFVEAVRSAQKSILIVGWDIDSRVSLLRGNAQTEPPLRLGTLLNDVVAKKPGLRVHVLVWDFALVFAFERQPRLLFRAGWQRHSRVRFRMDGEHPLGASHHQKIVVVDDKIAFTGGIDLTKARWDTPEHLPHNPDRKDPHGLSYQPFHDVQMLVDGDAAGSLGELARERWRRATGRALAAPGETRADPWPAGVRSDLVSVDVAVARTEPEHKGRRAVREVEALYQDSIRCARKWIYIENQYLTSSSIQESIASRLADRGGPEILLVMPKQCSGWLQESVMGGLRAGILHHLRASDRYDRLRIYYPVTSSSDGQADIMVHGKVMVTDNSLVRVGSSNLSNRSMGLDSECDLAIESCGNRAVEEAIASFRNRLISEHLGVSPEGVAGTIEADPSLIRAVESLRGNDRTLVPLEAETPEWLGALSPGYELLDPERPMEIDYMIDEFVPKEEKTKGRIKLGLIILLLAGFALAWRFGPLGDMLNVETATGVAQSLADSPAAAIYVLVAFVVGSLVVLPVTLLVTATAAVLDPVSGFVYALAGSLLSATVNYGLGSLLGREFVRTLAGRRLNRLSRRLAKKGFVAVLVVRMLPVAPFTIVNLVAGASHIRFRDFLLGTLLGMAPGILAITLLAHRIKQLAINPGLTNGLILALLLVLFGLSSWFLSRRLRGNHEKKAKDEATSSP